MKYFPLFYILPPEVVKIIINYIDIYYITNIQYFYRANLFKVDLIRNFIRSLLWFDNSFITTNKNFALDFIINNNWNNNYNRYFWCCFTNLLSCRIMRDNIHMKLAKRYNESYIENSKTITKLWFKLCKKYNLILDVTYYNFKSKKAEKSIIFPARNFTKPINNFYNILYTPIIQYNTKNNVYIIPYDDILDTLNIYCR